MHRPNTWRSAISIYLLKHHNFLAFSIGWFSSYIFCCVTMKTVYIIYLTKAFLSVPCFSQEASAQLVTNKALSFFFKKIFQHSCCIMLAQPAWSSPLRQRKRMLFSSTFPLRNSKRAGIILVITVDLKIVNKQQALNS